MCHEEGTKAGEGAAGMSCEEWLRPLGLSGLERRRLRGDLAALCSFLGRGRAEGGAELFSLVTSTRMHGSGSKLCCRGRFGIHMVKLFFTQRLVKPWNRLPGEVIDVLCLPVFERHLDNALNTLTFGHP